MNTFADSEKRVFNFMDEVNSEMNDKKQDEAFKNSTDYKLRTLDKCRDDAKEVCLDNIFAQLYRNAVPLNDDYKVAHAEDLDASFKDFMSKKCPKGIEYYIREGLKRKNPFAKRVLEAVEDLVDSDYRDKALNIEEIDVDDLPFKTSEDIVAKLNDMGNELSVPEISQTIKDNVKQTALSEITRAKDEKEKLQQLESELANDVNMRTQESVNHEIEMRGLDKTKDYVPTLFEAVMINKLNQIQPKYDSGDMQDVYLYNTLSEFGKEVSESGETVYASPEELAFVEAVKEYTCLSMLKALKLESFNKYEIRDMIDSYSQEKF